MIELTNRLTQCRVRTRFNVREYCWQAGCHTLRLFDPQGNEYQWSANPNHPDSRRAWERFEAAYTAAKARLPPVPVGERRTDLYLDVVSHPASDRNWENFWFTPPSVRDPGPRVDDPDLISDLFG